MGLAFLFGYFLILLCVLQGAELPRRALRQSVQAADHKRAWELEQASVRTWVRWEREFGWGFVGLLVFGVFLIKVEERFKDGGSGCRKYSQDTGEHLQNAETVKRKQTT